MAQRKYHRHTHQHILGHCPVCNLGYEDEAVEVLRRNERITVVHASCVRCGSAAILTVFSGVLGTVTTMGMLTDLAREDIERFWNAPTISVDDVLVAHTLLETMR